MQAPEQFEGRRVDERCDVFAFAVVMCEMLGGERPWSEASNPMQVPAGSQSAASMLCGRPASSLGSQRHMQAAACSVCAPAQIIYASGVLKRRPAIPAVASRHLRALIDRCWQHEPAVRPPFTEILDELQVLCAWLAASCPCAGSSLTRDDAMQAEARRVGMPA